MVLGKILDFGIRIGTGIYGKERDIDIGYIEFHIEQIELLKQTYITIQTYFILPQHLVYPAYKYFHATDL